MKKLLILCIAAAAFCGASAIAADMPVKATPLDPGYNWSGCYAGGDIGGVWSKSNIDLPGGPVTFDNKASSVAGGALFGCSYMAPSRWVLGIEGDATWMSLNSSNLTTGAANERYRTDWNSAYSIRGRLGYSPNTAPMTLWYITGGPTWAHDDKANFIPGLLVTNPISKEHSGWTIGAGIEHAFNQNWILGVEYLYAKYDNQTYVCAGCGPVIINNESNEIRARLSYKFGGDPWGKAPVSAKY